MPELWLGRVGKASECLCPVERWICAGTDGLRRLELLHGPGRLCAQLAPVATVLSDFPPESTARPYRYYIARAARNLSGWRPISFYLLFAILIVVVLGLGIVNVRDEPRQFAFYLIVLFVFFFVVMARAIMDCVEIWRRSFSEHERLYKDTLGEDEFVGRLARSVEDRHQSR